jgi:capsular polysaccharide biosynthesis protein
MKVVRITLWTIATLLVFALIFEVSFKLTNTKFQAHAGVQLEKDQAKCKNQAKELQLEKDSQGIARLVCK